MLPVIPTLKLFNTLSLLHLKNCRQRFVESVVIIFLMFVRSAGIIPLLFILFVYHVFCLFFVISLAGGLPILLIFSKRQLLVLLSCFVYFIISIILISANIVIFWGKGVALFILHYTFFSSFLRWKVRHLGLDYV